MTPRQRIFRLVIVHCLTQNLSLKCCLDLIIFDIHRHGCSIFLDYSFRPSERRLKLFSATGKCQKSKPKTCGAKERTEMGDLGVGWANGCRVVGWAWVEERDKKTDRLCHRAATFIVWWHPCCGIVPRRDINSNHQFHHSRQLTQAANIVEPVTSFTLYVRSGQIRGWIYMCPTNHTILKVKAILQISLRHHRFLLTIDQENHIAFFLVNNQFSQYDMT